LIRAGSEQELAKNLGHYAEADLILTGRLHGCIIGLAMGRKVLAVSGDHKLESFMQAAGLSEWVLGLDDMRSLEERLRRLPQQPTPAQFLDSARRDNLALAGRVRNALTAERG
jgi:hypothetical protein